MSKRTFHRPARSLLIFGSYALLMGLVLLVVPEMVLPWFGLVESGGTWVHVLGFVLCCSAYYYIMAARSGSRAFAWLTVRTRLAAPLVMLGLVLGGKADEKVLLFGVVDGLGGLWTWRVLWLEERIGSSEDQRSDMVPRPHVLPPIGGYAAAVSFQLGRR